MNGEEDEASGGGIVKLVKQVTNRTYTPANLLI